MSATTRLIRLLSGVCLLFTLLGSSTFVRAAGEECGKQANNTLCPLNVCCSQWGFCGVGPEFCDASQNCQSNCITNASPANAWGYDVRNTVIGYFETWAAQRLDCGKATAADIPVGSISHINAAFGYINKGDYSIYPIDKIDLEYFRSVTNLKTSSPSTKVWISLGGWTFSDNDTDTQAVWGDLASTAEKRQKFIVNLSTFMSQWGFDGVDLDWEYPGAPDRRGNQLDSQNYLALVQDIKAAFDAEGLGWGLSFTAPASYWYLKWFDVARMAKVVDFVNLMTYDMHGSWDDRSNWIGPHIYTHTNMTEIKQGLDLLWRNDVPAEKVNMGLAFYGRTYTLKDATCGTPGCEFSGPGDAGGCTDTPGYMSYKEIKELIEDKKLTPVYDKASLSKYVQHSGDQWMSFDDPESIKAKVDFANSVGLRGLFIWAVNQDSMDRDMLKAVMGSKGLGYFGGDGGATYTSYRTECKLSQCGANCGLGTVKVTDIRCSDGGEGKARRSLCCPISAAPDPNSCTWRAHDFLLSCSRGCLTDEIEMASDAFYTSGGQDKRCVFGGQASYCCKVADTGTRNCDWKPDTCVSLDKNKNLPSNACGSDKPITYRKGPCNGKDKFQPFCCKPGIDAGKLACHWKMQKNKFPDQVLCDWASCGQGEADLDIHELGGGVPTCEYQITPYCPIYPCFVSEGSTFRIKPRLCCNREELGVNIKTLPVPVENLFFADDLKSLPDGSTPDYDILTDPSMGGKQSSGGSGDPNSASFAWHIIDGPTDQVNNIAKRDGSHWEVYGCDKTMHEGVQTAKMVCTNDSPESNCGDIFRGGVEGTVIRMPKGCGPGKYAMAVSLVKRHHEPAPAYLRARNQRRGVKAPTVYELTFDYDFSILQKRGSTNVLLRIDYSDNPGYWNEIVAANPSRKRQELHETQREVDELYGGDWHDFLDHHWNLDRRSTPEHELHLLHARWFSVKLGDWIDRMKKVEKSYDLVRHTISDVFPITIFDESKVCQIGPVTQTLRASLRAQMSVDIQTSAQLTIMGNLGDLSSFKQSHLTLRNQGSIQIQVDFEVFAELRFGNIDNEIAGFAPVGASVVIPGIVTIGPQFKLLGGLAGRLAVHANARYVMSVASWDFAQSYPYNGDKPYDDDDLAIQDDGSDQVNGGVGDSTKGPAFSFDAGAEGSVEVHLTPQFTLGVVWAPKLNVPNAAIDFGVHTYGKVYAGASINSATKGVQYCYGVNGGYEVYVRAMAPNLFPGLLNLNRYWPIIPNKEVPLISPTGNNCGASQSRRSLSAEHDFPIFQDYQLGLAPEYGFVETIDKY